MKKRTAGSADSARAERKKKTKGPADLKPQDTGARKSGKPRASSSLSHIFSREMTSWFLNRWDAAALAFYDISLLKQRDTNITGFSNLGYLRDEGATLILQGLYKLKQCLVWQTQVSVTSISFFFLCATLQS